MHVSVAVHNLIVIIRSHLPQSPPPAPPKTEDDIEIQVIPETDAQPIPQIHDQEENAPAPAKEHTKNARPSTKGKHQKGEARKAKDRGGEKGDKKRAPPRKRPPNHKGPWPPKKAVTGS